MKNNLKKGVTIFTPTYNREKTLLRLYESLLNQNSNDFEWLIVDDGSTDNSKEVIKRFQAEDKIKIRYIYQKNQGKSAAYNLGVKNAKYNLFFCVDSDDFVGNNVINQIQKVNEIIFDKMNVVGIMGYKKNISLNKKNTKLINENYLTVSELYRRYHFNDEIALIYKTNILIDYPFPVIEGEKFVPEGYLYDQLDLIGSCYFIKDYIYYYEYQSDGYTNNSINLLKNNINGYILYSKNRLENSLLWQNRVRGAIQYNIANFIAKNGLSYLKNKNILLLLLTFVPSYVYYLRKYKIKNK